ncbi:GntR family transcriptional regulator [Corallococcus sp. CA049B]|uniref:FadR/GntR family transcriptional regulator n=1 Tax=Corallococcus sp. CA049B TaxID=2316730 RepID=UPI000EA105A2|nr:winged helix-turn-helix domain-containing protein [Corallococcus sp. CA049B]RKG89104.1 GntR family transcriptional regulator [Corallococcus sp. CA049B]
MVRVGLVAYVEEQLEREIALGRLPRNGRLASERMMARRYGVSRGTVREALRRLSARGLVVLHPGRQARVVALDESLTLENLGLALHGERPEECRRLLEGFFHLKRQVLVELLADCCANASVMDLQLLGGICFQLWDAARWHPAERCVQLEFELLRLAAQAAAHPGYQLLIQSLQRAFRGTAARLLPFMGGESLREWAVCAMHALNERDTQALLHQLPALLKACDERVLDAFASTSRKHASPEDNRPQECSPSAPASATAQDDAGHLAPADEALEVAPHASRQDCPEEADRAAPLFAAAPALAPCEGDGECAGGDETNAPSGSLSDGRTGCDASPPQAGLQPRSPSTGALGENRVTEDEAGGLLRVDCSGRLRTNRASAPDASTDREPPS